MRTFVGVVLVASLVGVVLVVAPLPGAAGRLLQATAAGGRRGAGGGASGRRGGDGSEDGGGEDEEKSDGAWRRHDDAMMKKKERWLRSWSLRNEEVEEHACGKQGCAVQSDFSEARHVTGIFHPNFGMGRRDMQGRAEHRTARHRSRRRRTVRYSPPCAHVRRCFLRIAAEVFVFC